MNYVTHAQLQQALAAQTADIIGVINALADRIDERFQKIENDINDLRQSHDRLFNAVDGLVGRIDRYETEQVARDHRMNRLERRIGQLGK